MKRKEQYTVQLDPEFVEKLDKLANKLGLTRSQLMRNLLINGYEETVVLDKLGLVAAVKFGQKVKEYKEKLLKELFPENNE